MTGFAAAPIDQRILSKVTVDANGCWLWTGYVKPNGYGSLKVPNTVAQAHRASYEAFVGPIPSGHDLDHLCRVRRCVNPYHLEAVTRQENLRRGAGRGGLLH